VPEAEVIRYSSPEEGIHRELFVQDGRIVGGALIGDLAGVGPLHAAMITERKIDEGIYEVLRPSSRVISRFVGDYFSQRLGSRFTFQEEVNA
jgi:NAD(P)H-nitrite reductase large subunit